MITFKGGQPSRAQVVDPQQTCGVLEKPGVSWMAVPGNQGSGGGGKSITERSPALVLFQMTLFTSRLTFFVVTINPTKVGAPLVTI